MPANIPSPSAHFGRTFVRRTSLLIAAALAAAMPWVSSQADTPPTPLPEPVVQPQLLANPTLLDLDGNGLPDGWYRSTREQGFVEKRDDDGRFLRIRVDASGESVILQQFAALPSGGGPITVAAKVRWADIVRGEQGYMTGCVQMMFADNANKKVGNFLPVGVFTGSSSGWQIIGQTFTPPPGATKFRVQLALYSVTRGALEILIVRGEIQALEAPLP